ncbi:MAG: ABC transporter permease [Bradyrhizobiaceae bacterium]|nr:ABC transporter permease [Bradyrhizobiaceae bacterium]
MTTTSLEEGIDRRTYSPVTWLLSRQTFWVFVAAVVIVAGLSLATDTFATQKNLFNVTRNFAFVGIIALGMTAVIITGGIDLSVGSIVCLAGIVLGVVMNAGWSIWAGVAAALITSLAIGATNGALIAYVRMPPFVVTLGMLAIARSLAMVASNNRMVYEFGPDQAQLLALGGGTTLGIANPVIALLVLALVTGYLFRWTLWGRHVFAIGGNEQAALATGVRVNRIKVGVYMICALTAGIAAVLEVGWLGAVTTNLGQSMELAVIAAAVIGGANLSGGTGTAFGAVIGAALIEVIRNSLLLLGVDAFWQGTFVGSFIVLAVMFDRFKGSLAE